MCKREENIFKIFKTCRERFNRFSTVRVTRHGDTGENAMQVRLGKDGVSILGKLIDWKEKKILNMLQLQTPRYILLSDYFTKTVMVPVN